LFAAPGRVVDFSFAANLLELLAELLMDSFSV
jgi:hypothetical protein